MMCDSDGMDGGWCGQPKLSLSQPTSLPAFDLPPWVVRRGYGVGRERGTMP